MDSDRLTRGARFRIRKQAAPLVAVFLITELTILGMPQPSPPRPGNTAARLGQLLRQAETTTAVDKTAERALAYSRAFVETGRKRLKAGQVFSADRLADASDALLHVAEHEKHLRTRRRPEEGPPLGPLQDHLQRAYFRIQQADYFLSQARDARVRSFPSWSRDFYQLAVQALERHDRVAAEENIKSADDIIRALENLAQAASAKGAGPL